MFGQFRQPQPQQIPEDSHVHGKSSQIVCKVALGKNSLDQVYHDLDGVFLIPVHDLEDKGGQHVEPLAVAYALVPPRIGQENSLEEGLIVLLGPAEQGASRPVEVLKKCNPSSRSRSIYRQLGYFGSASFPFMRESEKVKVHAFPWKDFEKKNVVDPSRPILDGCTGCTGCAGCNLGNRRIILIPLIPLFNPLLIVFSS